MQMEDLSVNTPHGDSGIIGFCHVGMHARDPASMAEFYRDVMGMQIVGGSDESHPLGRTAFLSSRPDEEYHELAMFSDPAFAHQAFKVKSLTDLKRFYDSVVARGIPIKHQFLHGVAIAFYFDDPEGNMIEVYWSTGIDYPQPHVQDLDLSKDEPELLDELKALTGQAAARA